MLCPSDFARPRRDKQRVAGFSLQAKTGFQSYHPEKSSGYLTLFRGINNRESARKISLRFIKDRRLRLDDLISGSTKTITVDETGTTEFEIDAPTSFRFYRYEILTR